MEENNKEQPANSPQTTARSTQTPQTTVYPNPNKSTQQPQNAQQPSGKEALPTSPQSTKPNKKKFLLIGLVLLIIAVAGASLVYYFQNKDAETQPTPSPSEMVEQPKDEIPTKNVTYTNTAYNFSVEVPEFEGLPEENINFGFFGKKITFYIGENNPLECKSDCPVIENSSTVTLAGTEATKIEGSIEATGGSVAQQYIDYVFPLESGYLTFSLYARNRDDITPNLDGIWEIEEKDIEMFDQILSTFEFTNTTRNSEHETSANTACSSNKDCYCQGFTGAKFLPVKIESDCDLETNRCVECVYF